MPQSARLLEYGVLFDYNGVLAGDEHLQEQAMARVAARYGSTVTHAAYQEMCLGRSDRSGFERLQEEFSSLRDVPVEELIQQKIAEYERLIKNETVIYPAVSHILQKLQPEFSLGIVSGSVRREIQPVLERAGIANFFQVIVTADDTSRGKPNPEGYLKGTKGFNLPPENIVAVEDTPSGIQAASAAGLKSIAVLHTSSPDRLVQADRVVESIEEITPGLVREIINQKE